MTGVTVITGLQRRPRLADFDGIGLQTTQNLAQEELARIKQIVDQCFHRRSDVYWIYWVLPAQTAGGNNQRQKQAAPSIALTAKSVGTSKS